MTAATGPSPAVEDAGAHKRDRVRLAVEIIGALVAICALIFGFVQKTEANNATTTVTNQEQTINNYGQANSSLQSAYDLATSSNAQLASQVSSLQSAVTTTVTVTPSSTSGSGSSAADGVGTVYHADPLVLLPSGDAANLDAPSTDHGWTRTVDNGFPDFSFNGVEFRGQAFSQIKQSNKGDYPDCSSSGFGGAAIPYLEVPVNSFICVKTSDGRYAALQLQSADPKQATFDVKVYDN